LLGAGILALAWLAAHAGFVAVAGRIPVALAPDIFLLGVFFVAFGVSRALTARKAAAALLAAALTVLAGLNTRIPILFSDLGTGSGGATQIRSHLIAPVGQPIHIRAEPAEISARRQSYAHAIPACYGDSCLASMGFRTPYPWIESDYWHEKPLEVALIAGFSTAKEQERAPTLNVRQDTEGQQSTIQIELLDTDGKSIALFKGRYRHGLPYETADGTSSNETRNSLALEYLLHGNLLNRLAERYIPAAPSYPLASFLSATALLSHPQGTALGLAGGAMSSETTAPSLRVELETLEQKDYDPVWVIPNDASSSNSRWIEMSWDKQREATCGTILKPEQPGAPLLQSWQLFVRDSSGRKKARYTGPAICDADLVWFLDYPAERGRTTLTKYSVDGDLLYRLSFSNPPELHGFGGAILQPTFRAQDGYLLFEWWNTNQAGRDMQVKRSMKLRLKEPGAFTSQ
jgi:hypothetical protein